MSTKYFDFIEKKSLSKEQLREIREDREKILSDSQNKQREIAAKKIQDEDHLTHVEGRVVVKIDVDYKNTHRFENGQIIRRERQFNELNRRITEPCNAFVISGEGIKKGAEILIHPNAIHDSQRIFNYKDSNDTVRYYAIKKDECFAWYDGNEWLPLEPYAFALQVFKPYEGLIAGIEPTQLKDTLFVLTGELKHKVVKTIPFSAYIIIFQDTNGRESQLLRFRPFGDAEYKREEEAIAIMETDTKKVLSDQYLIGLSNTTAKTYSQCFRQPNTSPPKSTDSYGL
jgi:hypothetical protein